MARVTKANAESAFKYLAETAHKRVATDYNDVGAWRLDYAGGYGGFIIEEILTEGGAVRHPLGSQRRNAASFYDAAWFAVRIVEEMQRNG